MLMNVKHQIVSVFYTKTTTSTLFIGYSKASQTRVLIVASPRGKQFSRALARFGYYPKEK